MDRKVIEDVLTGLDSMYEKAYDLKESIIDNLDCIGEKKHRFNRESKNLIDTLITAIYNSSSDEKKEKKEHYMNVLIFKICKTGNLEIDHLIKTRKSRKRELVILRQVHMAFLHKTFSQSQTVAANIYEKDHVTALHAVRTIRNLYQTDKTFRKEFQEVIDFCLNYDKLMNQNNTIEYLTDESE